MAFAQSARPIPGAVATLGVSDRVTFLRKTYAHLGLALIAFALLAGGMMRFMPETSLRFAIWTSEGWNFFLVIAGFLGAGYAADRMAQSQSSKAIQYLGLLLGVAAFGLLLQPILWRILVRFGGDGMFDLISQSTIVTLVIFVGLSATVFITKKDFSFLRGALVVGTFAALGMIIASMLFGFSLGVIFSAFVIMLMAGYILYQTTLIMSSFPPTAYVAAALMLFSTVATLFIYVLRLLSALRSN